jgi:hypothetical protein
MGRVSYGLGGRVREDASRLFGPLAGAAVEVSGTVVAFSPGRSAANTHLTFANGTASRAVLSGGSVVLSAEREARK